MEFKYNDYELLYLVSENIEEALEIIFKKYEPLIKARICKFKIRYDRFDDFLQEGYLILYRAVQRYDQRYMKTFNKYFDFYLQKGFMNILEKESKYFYNTIITDDATVFMESQQINYHPLDIRTFILSDTEKLIFDLRFQKGMKIELITEILNCTPKYVYNAIVRIKKKLYEELQ